MNHDLSCAELVTLVTDYLEGALRATDEDRFREHLARCQGCRVYLEQMEVAIRVAGRLTEKSVPQEAWGPLLTAFRSWREGEGSGP